MIRLVATLAFYRPLNHRIAYRIAHCINYARLSLQLEVMCRKWQVTHGQRIAMTDLISKAFFLFSSLIST